MTLSIITEADNLSTVSNEKALIKSVGKKTSIKTDDKKTIIELQKETVIEYLTDHVSCKSSDIAKLLNIKLTRSRDILNSLIADGIVVAEGANRNRTYRLKEKG